ncbi:hypothetical protein JGU71_10600 [Antrihabitans sp. YC3-6]|uniref:Uncharacterized protein n=1 Tax=Antrihabitans stalagmiti TaxID=2799499 RepID=A0A934NQ29_9NOCA|nr:hypothetical protein [Antrihabitans stalagmiti]MBJ8339339.1 hypothetical protein [Antrihabitans stalagmiti]
MTLSPQTSGRLAAAVLGSIAGFQAALAAGAPLGAAAYGGAHPGTVPNRLRAVSAAAVPIYLGLAAVAVGAVGTPRVRDVVTRVGAVGLALGVPINLASPSLPERTIWPPVAAAGAVLLWRAAPRASLEGKPAPASS